jgi:hypothetical protein
MLTILSCIPVFAHTPGLGKLDYAVTGEAAVIFTIEDATILTNVRRGTLEEKKWRDVSKKSFQAIKEKLSSSQLTWQVPKPSHIPSV